jgi:D-lactate dehydrogenase
MGLNVAVFSTKNYDRESLINANATHGHELTFLEARLCAETIALASGMDAVCAFVNDQLSKSVLEGLAASGVRIIALRCAGFNNVNLRAAAHFGMQVVRVPAYSPYSVAEHTLGLMLCLNRKLHRAYNRVREGNFALDGLMGFDLSRRTVGVVGTGKIGETLCQLLAGFRSHVYAYDIRRNPECEALGVEYVDLETLFEQSDVVSLHCPLTPETKHMINDDSIASMRDGVMLINTSRGALLDTQAVIRGLKSRKIGYLGLDVYEEEEALFFEDLSGTVLQDDVFARLLTFPNVLITGHQAFFTEEALGNIAQTTIQNLSELDSTGSCENAVELPDD